MKVKESGIGELVDVGALLKMMSGTDMGRIVEIMQKGEFISVDDVDIPKGAEFAGKMTRLDMAMETFLEELREVTIAENVRPRPDKFAEELYLVELTKILFRVQTVRRLQYDAFRRRFAHLDIPGGGKPGYVCAGDYEVYRIEVSLALLRTYRQVGDKFIVEDTLAFLGGEDNIMRQEIIKDYLSKKGEDKEE